MTAASCRAGSSLDTTAVLASLGVDATLASLVLA
jgi:hypothetical protein